MAGSNGLVAGMVPLLCACFIADWKTMAFPFLQVLCALAAVGLHVTIAIIQVTARNLCSSWKFQSYSTMTTAVLVLFRQASCTDLVVGPSQSCRPGCIDTNCMT